MATRKYGLRVLDLVGHARRHAPIPVGKWISKADVDAHDGRGMADFSLFPGNALTFESFEEAMKFWSKQSTVKPLRDDGKPNRPLTAFTVEVAELP